MRVPVYGQHPVQHRSKGTVPASKRSGEARVSPALNPGSQRQFASGEPNPRAEGHILEFVGDAGNRLFPGEALIVREVRSIEERVADSKACFGDP